MSDAESTASPPHGGASSERQTPSVGVRKPRRRLMLALQILGTCAGFAWLAASVDFARVRDRVFDVAPFAFVAAIALTLASQGVGAMRWRHVLRAYGARPSSLRRLLHLYLVGFFYNSYLPGGVGGDLVRGLVTRESFDRGGATAALAVVFVERVLGLVGLLLVVAGVVAWRPPAALQDVLPVALVGIAVSVGAIAALALARRLRGLGPRALAHVVDRLPALVAPPHFAGALALSLATHGLVALSGWAVLHSLDPRTTLAQAFIVVPVAAATAFLPITVGGAGAREATFVVLCAAATPVGAADATASALALWGAHLAVAAFGGVLQLLRPLRGDEDLLSRAQ